MKTQVVLAAASAALAAVLAGCATQEVKTASIPDTLRVPSDQMLSREVHATGVQIYECQPSKTDASRMEWVLKGPEADLFDKSGAKFGRHYAGPTWEANDGSKVVGAMKARDDGPDPNAIPWLLLTAASSSPSGTLGRTVSVQRLRTVGGKAPADGCIAGQAGREARVPYSADYLFYVARS